MSQTYNTLPSFSTPPRNNLRSRFRAFQAYANSVHGETGRPEVEQDGGQNSKRGHGKLNSLMKRPFDSISFSTGLGGFKR